MKITKHAIDRYRQRTGATCSDIIAEDRILSMMGRADEVRLKEECRVASLLAHKFELANYYILGELVFVVVNNSLVTIHKNDKRKFIL